MPNAVDETSAVTATVFAKRFQPDPPRAIISEEPACDSEPRCHETQTELARANRVAIPEQLSASIAHEVKLEDPGGEPRNRIWSAKVVHL